MPPDTAPPRPLPEARLRQAFAVPLILTALACAAAPAGAQVIRGTLIDDATGQPVALGEIRLVDGGRDLPDRAITDDDGGFRIAVTRPGTYQLRASHLAYRSGLSPALVLIPGDTVVVEMRVHPTAVVLAPLTVHAASRAPLQLRLVDEFYERQRRGFGIFLDPEAVRRANAFNTSDLLRDLPGVSVRRQRAGAASVFLHGTFGPCSPSIVVDGVRLRVDSDFPLDLLVSGGDVRAVEVYRRFGEVPAQYAVGGHFGCGAVVIWTRSSMGDAPPARTAPRR